MKTLTSDERLFIIALTCCVLLCAAAVVFFEVTYGENRRRGRIEIILKDDGTVGWERKSGNAPEQQLP